MKTLFTTLSVLALLASSSLTSFADWGRPPPPPGWDHGGGHGGPGWGHDRAQYVSCASGGYRLERCAVNGFIRNAQLVRQDSSSACVLGQSWGYERNTVWVDRGCRATILVYLY